MPSEVLAHAAPTVYRLLHCYDKKTVLIIIFIIRQPLYSGELVLEPTSASSSSSALRLPSSPSSIFGGGISIIFFKTSGNELGAPAAVSTVTRSGSPDIFIILFLLSVYYSKFTAEQVQKKKMQTRRVSLITPAPQPAEPPSQTASKSTESTQTNFIRDSIH